MIIYFRWAVKSRLLGPRSDSAVMGVRPSVFELHLGDAWRLEVKLAEQRVLSPQHHACGVPVAEAQTARSSRQHHGSDRAEEEQSRRMRRLRFSIMVCATPMGRSRLNCPHNPLQGVLCHRFHSMVSQFTALLFRARGLSARP